VPDAAALTELLRKGRVQKVRITKITEVELPKPEAVFELTISDLG
jgi:hypothetical protein